MVGLDFEVRLEPFPHTPPDHFDYVDVKIKTTRMWNASLLNAFDGLGYVALSEHLMATRH